jgi:hypothetical protein
MASIVKGSPDHPILFQITAELTRYKKQPYLIVRSAEYIRPATGEAEDTP